MGDDTYDVDGDESAKVPRSTTPTTSMDQPGERKSEKRRLKRKAEVEAMKKILMS